MKWNIHARWCLSLLGLMAGCSTISDETAMTPSVATSQRDWASIMAQGDAGTPADERDRTAVIETALKAAQSDTSELLMLLRPDNRLIQYGLDQASIPHQQANVITQHANFLRDHRKARLLVAGFADESGGTSYNLALSERRANTVCQKLAGLGVNPARLTCVGYGESQPPGFIRSLTERPTRTVVFVY